MIILAVCRRGVDGTESTEDLETYSLDNCVLCCLQFNPVENIFCPVYFFKVEKRDMH